MILARMKILMCLLPLASCVNSGEGQTGVLVTNHPPTAQLEGNFEAFVGEAVTLSGEQSQDQDNDSLTYLWTLNHKPTHSRARLKTDDEASTSFIPDKAGRYVINLIVHDGSLASESQQAVINVAQGAIDLTHQLLTERNPDCGYYQGNYTARAQDVNSGRSFTSQLSIRANRETCVFGSNVIPNHDFNDSARPFPHRVKEQSDIYQVPRYPLFADSTTSLELGVTNAIMLNGVVIDLLAAACFGVKDGRQGCFDINTPWRYNPGSPLAGFNTDSHNAHVQPNGTYHYHASPNALFATEGETASPVIGFAADGFPIYGPFYSDEGKVSVARSSFQLKTGMRSGGPGGRFDGTYRDDFEYVAGSGDLDECNGMERDGQYGYYITQGYPYVMNCFKGKPDPSFRKRGQRRVNLLHKH